MEYQTLQTDSGNIVIKDAEEPELNELIKIYSCVFKKHNILQKPEKEVLEYLKKSHKENKEVGGGYIVARLNNKTIGGILLRKRGQDLDGKHVLWKYNHVAVAGNYAGAGLGTALLNAAEQKIRNLIKDGKTAKIEIRVSETEKDALDFYKKLGFEIEGKLKSHFRLNELAYAMGKEIKE